MPGGLLQLISNGTQDSYLSLNPEFTFFKFVYKNILTSLSHTLTLILKLILILTQIIL